jgi:hypothetical protein
LVKQQNLIKGEYMEDNNKCGHAGCSCTVKGDDKYCSAICESAEGADVQEIVCECGHSGCA